MLSHTYSQFRIGNRLLALLLLLCISVPLQAQDNAGYVPGEVLVGIRADKDDAGLSQRLAFIGVNVEQIARLHVHRLRLVPGLSVQAAITALQLLPDVTYAEPNIYLYGCATPNNPNYSGIDTNPYSLRNGQAYQYGPQRVQADVAWNIWQPRQTVYIAVLDTGVDDTHPGLTNKMYRDSNGNVIGYNIGVYNYHSNDKVSTMDDNGHGTFNAGIAAAQINNGVGMAGVAGWNGVAGQTDTNNVKIIPVKVLYNDSAQNDENVTHAYGNATVYGVAKGIDWVANLSVNGKKVISMSLEVHMLDERSPPVYGAMSLQSAVAEAHNDGCLLVAAAGNDGQTQAATASSSGNANQTDYYTYPACLPNVISVAASDSTDTLTQDSHYGDWVNVAAPGFYVYSTMPTYSVSLNNGYVTTNYSRPSLRQNYDYISGTSQACPHVSGEAALIWSQNPSLTNDQVHDLIINNTDPVTPYYTNGGIANGRINVYRALLAATGHGSDVTLTSAGAYLYGTTLAGGAYNRGALFLADPSNANPNGAAVVLHSFGDTPNGDGAHPFAAPILAGDGHLYGTCSQGGAFGLGTVYRILPNGSGYATIYNFGQNGGYDQYGANPRCTLQETPGGGTFVGTTPNGGSSHQGTVFAVNPQGGFQILHSFAGGSGGASPVAGVVLGSDGYYWGTTPTGGAFALGSVFRLPYSAVPTDFLSVYSFGQNGGYDQYGSFPSGPLVEGTGALAGTFFGTTRMGGSGGKGLIYAVNAQGGFNPFHALTGTAGGDGAVPFSGLTLGSDGVFWGTASQEGVFSLGAVFRQAYSTDPNARNVPYSFGQSGGYEAYGAFPLGGLREGSGARVGTFYGTTSVGGQFGQGLVYGVNAQGGFTPLFYFPTGF